MRFVRWVVLLSLVLLPLAPAYAQGVGASADVKGTVTDPAGAVLPGASITLLDVARGLVHTATTDAEGQYRFAAVPPTTYDVRVELSGFEIQVKKGIAVAVGQTAIVDFTVKISAVVTEVSVSGEAPLVETEKTQQANTLGEQYIRQLPIDRRDYLSFTLLAPGVVDSNAFADNTDFRVTQTPQSGLSFYGSNGRGNNVTVDGAEANDDSGSVRRTLSQEAVQEFQINRSNYSAEFGGASGGVINIVSKSGTNELHGSGFLFLRHDALDARDPFAIAPPPLSPFAIGPKGTPVDPPSDRQQFGGTAGFPLRHDKAWLFVAYEGLRRDESAAAPVLTDTSIFAPTAGQASILSALAARGTATIPCLSSPLTVLPAAVCAGILSRILTVDPTTSGAPESAFMARSEPFLVDLFARNSGIFPFTARSDQFSARLDFQLNPRNQLFIRYNLTDARERNTNLRALVGFSRGNLIEQFDSTIAVGWYRQFSPRLQNEARSQWNYYTLDVTPNDSLGPEINIAGFGFFNRDIFLPSFTTGRRYEVADNLTFITGSHKMKFGGYLLVRDNESESHTFFPGRFNFGELPGLLLSPCLGNPAACGLTGASATLSALQSFKLGLPQFYQQGFDNPTVESILPLWSFYWQDTWAARSNLTLNFGLRYERDHRREPLRTDNNNFGPRLGWSWDPFKDKKTVLRGGYGIYYSPIYYQIDYVVRALGIVNGFRQIAQVFASLRTAAPCAPLGVSTPTVPLSACIFQSLLLQRTIGCTATSGEACISPANLTQFGINITHTGPIPPLTVIFSGSNDYVNPYSQQGSFGIEREILPNLSISSDYIFARTLKITRARDKNLLAGAPVDPTLGIRRWDLPVCGTPTFPNACFADLRLLQDNVYESTARAFYHGWIVTLTKRFDHHFSLLASYTFSKAIDEVTDFNSDFQPNDQASLRAERALSAFDQRHKLVIAGVLESPWQGGAGAHPLARVFSGFTLSPVLRGNSARPFNLLVGADINGDRHSTTDRPPGVGRNTGHGPDFWTLDLRLTRRIGFGERRSLELMFEAFNLFNRVNFASLNNTVGLIGPPFDLRGRRDRTPSQPLGFTSVVDPRRIQLGLRLNF